MSRDPFEKAQLHRFASTLNGAPSAGVADQLGLERLGVATVGAEEVVENYRFGLPALPASYRLATDVLREATSEPWNREERWAWGLPSTWLLVPLRAIGEGL